MKIRVEDTKSTALIIHLSIHFLFLVKSLHVYWSISLGGKN
jgi:hypothetical protein